MTEEEGLLLALSDAGPLISVFQSSSFDLVLALFDAVHTSETCKAELIRHGWEEALAWIEPDMVYLKLTDSETEQAREFARRIAAHPLSDDREPVSHLGEAEVMALAQRAGFEGAVLLLDEQAARAVAKEAGLTISGFAGVLLLAVEDGLISPDEVRERLERCRQQGTHYSVAFIERVYQLAKESTR